ncbi:MAG: hypothetical protein IT435_15570 [Phycisphaerales bacterium]|nr:hypothetical protein [Phycisphaerales bacterium]
MGKRIVLIVLVLAVIVGGWLAWRHWFSDPLDDGGGLTTADLPEISVDVFKEMDNGIVLTADEIKGRNAWMLWTAGNEQFWDHMARESFGLVDLLKTLDTRKRGSRFREAGMVNEPGFKAGEKPDQHGLWLDERVDPPQAGVDEKVYGRASGIVGLRIFPNPAFDASAQQAWDPKRFYDDPDYYLDKDLVRPYRIGMSCGFCHVAPNPIKPPADPENPQWQNLASLIGNQYLREGAAFAYGVKKGNFLAEMLNAQPPGTSDTSRIASDHINNPNAINAIFNVPGRLSMAEEETMAGGTLNLVSGDSTGVKRKVPRILKDGADSIGASGATIRVFVNIGMYHQHWLKRHNALVGLTSQKPFEIGTAQKKSVYWRATEERLPNLIKFFLNSPPMHLEDADGGNGKKYITTDEKVLTRGKMVFAQNCAECHSSKQPPANIKPGSDEAIDWFEQEIVKPDFREGNFYASERRYPVTRIKTNAARAMATNAKDGHVWDNFSSRTYKDLPSPGSVDVYDPINGTMSLKMEIPAGGQGYYRPPSLVSIWTSAPFFHNNALGKFTGDPSVAGRMAAFDDACEKLLWPEKRLGVDSIWRTKERSYIELEREILPRTLRPFCDEVTDAETGRTHKVLRIGPIPAGTPINLLANLDPDLGDLVRLAPKLKLALLKVNLEKMDDTAAREMMRKELLADLLAASKCPDLVTDKGHEFGSELPDEDKRALIEYLKTL